MTFVHKSYNQFRDTWYALSRWDRFVHRHKRKLGMKPVIIVHQSEYVIKGWLVPLKADGDGPGVKWGTLHAL